MKNFQNDKQLKTSQSGFSTLEIVIAFAILVIALSGVIYVLFCDQSTAMSSQTNSGALYRAQQIIEDARASKSHTTFPSIISAGLGLEDIYQKALQVSDISQCAKQLTGTVTWNDENRPQNVTLSTVITDPLEALALGGSCASVGPGPDDFRRANSFHGNVTLDGSGTSIRVRGNILYLGSKHNNPNSPDLSIANISDIPNLDDSDFIKLAINHGGSELNGINDFELVDYLSLGKRFIFAAGNYGNPGGGGPTGEKPQGQLQVVDVTDYLNPAPVASLSLPGVSGECNDYCPSGRKIAYYDGKVYSGTHRVGGSEFHIYDVTDPFNPIHLGNTCSTQIEHNINDIIVRNGRAYLATSSDTEEVIVLNVAGCVSPGTCPITQIGVFDAKDISGNPSDEDGQTLFLIGTKLYLGRDRVNSANERDFYILDADNLNVLGSKKINNQNNTTITGIQISSGLAFIASTDSNNPFSVWDVSDPSDINRWDVCSYNFSVVPVEMYFDSNRIYVAATDQSDVRIIESALTCN